jgi:CRISPR system Cascade subunit CasE
MFMVRLHLEARKVQRRGRERNLIGEALDMGYLVHCSLREMFGDAAPQPFVISSAQRTSLEVLGYASLPANDLRMRINPSASQAYGLNMETLAAKRMPDRIPAGTRLQFRVRVCPVVRKASNGPIYQSGAEIDAFLAEVEKSGKDVAVNREDVYRKWLTRQFKGDTFKGGAACESARLACFRQIRIVRRDKHRQPCALRRPDVTLEGILEVQDPERFQQLLRHGVGRHRAFGFGMLLIRR